MLLLENQTGSAAAGGEVAHGFRLRLRCTGSADQFFSLQSGKSTIGSSPRCTVRIEQPGVQPLDCLIVQEQGSLSVRRWAEGTRLNGEPFNEARLTPGDCLTVGSVELMIEASDESVRHHAAVETPHEVDDATPEFASAVQRSAVWLNDDQRTPWLNDPNAPDQPHATAEAELDSFRWSPGVERTVVPFEAAKIVFRELQTATAISRGRSRKLIAALRQNRDEFNRLAERVEDLESLMQAALFDREGVQIFPGENAEAGGVESTILKRSMDSGSESSVTPFPADDRQADTEISQLRSELAQIAEAQQQLADEKVALTTEIDALRERLVAAQQQIAHWEQAAAEWQRERADWSSQHENWNREREELEQQIAASEIRLAECARRIESLEQEMAPLGQPHAVPQEQVDWTPVPILNAAGVETPTPSTPELPPAASTWGDIGEDDEHSPEIWQGQTPATDEQHPWPAIADKASDSDDSEESDLASFAEFSIWNQGAITPPPTEDPVGQQAAIVNGDELSRPSQAIVETAPQQVQAESFIERYAHMFADDDSTPEQPQPAPAPRPEASDATVQKPRNMGIVRREAESTPTSAAPTTTGDDEESIEQYMAKLLQRVRGDAPRMAASQAPPPGVVPNTSAVHGVTHTEPLNQPSPENAEPQWPTATVPMAEAGEQVTTSLGTTRRKVPLAEQSADLEAFRALANESARRAISTHASRKHRRNAVTKFIVSTLAGMTSLWMMLEAPHWQDLQFITACVSLLVAAYWAGETYRTLIETLRAAAYDGPDDGLKDLVEALRPQLPIDVEN